MYLKIYNTLSRQKELFVPLMEDPNYKGPKKDFVGLYSCGPTVYGLPHFGNVRAAFTADLIRNTLQNIIGYKTVSVMNITDVGHLVGDSDDGEEKIAKAARLEGLDARAVAKKYEQVFLDFFKDLKVDPFTVMPRATEHIQEQIDLVKQLEDKGYTYIIPNDGVYMDTSKVEDYGKLMGPNYKKHLEGIRGGERVDLKGKKNATDFALWKFHIGGGKRDMERESPRGIGFPGRHAECSAMSSKYLGTQFDIHHGGCDLISVHHTNEIAQSECSSEVHPRVKYWMHNEFVLMNGKKMAKSDGNIVSPYDVIEKGYSYVDMRYFFFTTHYRTFFNFTWESIKQAQQGRLNLIKKIQRLFSSNHQKNQGNAVFLDDGTIPKVRCDQHAKIIVDQSILVPYEKIKDEIESKYAGDSLEEMVSALMDDLNTPQLIAIINQTINAADKMDEIDKKDLFIAFYRLEKNLLKIGLFDRIGQEVKKVKIPTKIQQLAAQRLEAKQAKDYARADEIRKEILALGREVKDTKESYELIEAD